MIERQPITDRVLTELNTLSLPVGDNNKPEAPFGWQGEPNADGGNFIPWMVLTAGQGRQQARPGSFGDSNSEWVLSYSVFCAGVRRDQIDWLADKVRTKLTSIARENVNGWRIQQLRCVNIGGTVRINQTFPDYYQQVDVYEISLSKEM